MFPGDVPALLFQRDDVGRASVHHGDNHEVFSEDRRSPEVPVEPIPSILVLQILFPDSFALEVDARQVSALVIGEDVCSIGDW